MKRLHTFCSLSLAGVCASLLLSGCSGTQTFPDSVVNPPDPTETSAPPIQGSVFGGHAPIVGAQVYVLSPSLNAFAGPGIAASGGNQSKSLMCGDTPATACTPTGSGNGTVSPSGTDGYHYVTTDSTGSFNLTGDYACSVNQEVYIVAVGGTAEFGTSNYFTISNVTVGTVSGGSATMSFTVSNPPEEFYTGETILFSGFPAGALSVLNGQSGAVLADGNLTLTNFDVTLSSGTLTAKSYSTGGVATGMPNANAAIVNMATLGLCPSSGNFSTAGNGIGTIPFIFLNEISTAATAFATAGFGTDAFHIGAKDGDTADGVFKPTGYTGSNTGDPRASYTKNGMKQAFFNAYNLYDITGTNVSTSFAGEGHIARTATPQGQGAVPQTTIDTIGNILAACVDSANTSSSPSKQCTTLFTNASSNGVLSTATPSATVTPGTAASDIAAAAYNLAHYPAGVGNSNFVKNLYQLPSKTVPFSPNLSTQPNDFTIEIQWTIPHVSNPNSIVIDGNNYIGGEYGGAGATGPEEGIFVIDGYNGPTKFFARTGVPDTTFNNNVAPYTQNIDWHGGAVDFNNNIWLTAAKTNNLDATSNYGGTPEFTGTPVTSPSIGFVEYSTDDTLTGKDALVYPFGITIDRSANIYVANPGPLSITNSAGNPLYPNLTGGNLDKVSNTGADIPASGGAAGTPFYNGGYGNSSKPTTNAIDANGIVYTMDATGFILALNGATGTSGTSPFDSRSYGGGLTQSNSGTTAPYNNAGYISVDHNNVVWVTNSNNTPGYYPGLFGYLNGYGSYIEGTNNTGPSKNIADSGGMNQPCSTAVDGAGTIWVGNAGNASVSAFAAKFTAPSTETVTTLSPDATSGSAYNTGGYAPLTPSTAPTCAHPAIDRAGNVWLVFPGTSAVSSFVYELVGAAAPTVTPIAYAAATNQLGVLP